MEDFSKVSTQGIAQAKEAAEELKKRTKAEASVDHSLRRKELLPPTQAEYKQAARRQTELVKEVNLKDTEKERAKVKRQAKRYKQHFGPRVGHCVAPSAAGSLEEWKDYLWDMQAAIGAEHAEEDFTTAKNWFFQGVEVASVKYPDLFMHQNLVAPISLAKTVATPEFDAEIADERAEICILYEEWFSRGPFSRLLSATASAITKVAMANAEMGTKATRDAGGFDHLVDSDSE